jgi:hypothetical protein
MGKKDFDEYISTIQKIDSHDDFKKQQLQEWNFYLNDLYDTIIKEWMQEYIKKGTVNYKLKKKSIYEEFSGEYEVDALELTLQGKTLLFDPIGTMLIGAKGRIDLKGKNGNVMLVLVDKNATGPNIRVEIFTSEKERKERDEKQKKERPSVIEWKWKVVVKNDQMKYEVLDEEVFFDIIMEVIGS